MLWIDLVLEHKVAQNSGRKNFGFKANQLLLL